MVGPKDIYVNGIRKKLGKYYAAWFPNEELKLGDIGILEENCFTRWTSLEALGISFEVRSDNSSTPINYTSGSDVSMDFQISGQVNPMVPSIPNGKAGIGIKFSKEGAFIIQAAESYESSIENKEKLDEDIRQAFKDGKWKSKWVVINSIVSTPCATILISNSSESKIDLYAKAKIPTNIINLGDAKIEFSISSQSGDIMQFLNAKNLTPIFQLMQMSAKPFFSNLLNFNDLVSRKIHPLDVITPDLTKADNNISQALYMTDASNNLV
jgi:hypothetical protein